jgi:hypothetical protein
MLPLVLGSAVDIYDVSAVVIGNRSVRAGFATLLRIVLLGPWFIFPRREYKRST